MNENNFLPGTVATFIYNGEMRTGTVDSVKKGGTPDAILTMKCSKRDAYRSFRLDKMTAAPQTLDME